MTHESEDQERRKAAFAEVLKGDRWVFESDISLVSQMDGEVERRLVDAGWDEEVAIDLMLGVHEAVINAMKHGNENDPAKKVTVDLKITPEALTVTISDEGQGYDWEHAFKATTSDTHGRGIDAYLRPHFNEMNHNEDGNELTLVRHKDKPPGNF